MLLKYTGHPLIDVGLATLAAFVGKQRPEELSEDDLETFANWAIKEYDGNSALKTWLMVSAFPGSIFTQPPLQSDKFTEDRLRYLKQDALFAWRERDALEERCAFCERPAVLLGSRSMIPMFMSGIYFSPEGMAGLPACGYCMLALHAMPMGCLPSEGRLLLVHSHAYELTQRFVKGYLTNNRRILQILGLEKMPNYRHAKTRLLEELELVHQEGLLEEESGGVTAYHFTNSGQGPKLDIYQLPSFVIRFIREARTRYPEQWAKIVQRAWALSKEDYKRNYFYEDLFSLPDGARRFLHVYILRNPLKAIRNKEDPRRDYSTYAEAELISWGIAELLLEMMNMERERIEQIRGLGDALAQYILARDERFFSRLYMVRDYPALRRELIRAAKDADATLVPFDTFVAVFEDSEEVGRPDWRLAFDLLLIRIIEQLHKGGKDDLLKETTESAAESEPAA